MWLQLNYADLKKIITLIIHSGTKRWRYHLSTMISNHKTFNQLKKINLLMLFHEIRFITLYFLIFIVINFSSVNLNSLIYYSLQVVTLTLGVLLLVVSIMVIALVSIVIATLEAGSVVLGCRGNHHSALLHRRVEAVVAIHPALQHRRRKLMGVHSELSLKTHGRPVSPHKNDRLSL